MLVKYILSYDISQAFLPFRFVDVIVITDHDLFWNVGPLLQEIRSIFVIKAAVETQNNLPFCD
jgi:hypothetical protein